MFKDLVVSVESVEEVATIQQRGSTSKTLHSLVTSDNIHNDTNNAELL